MWSPLCHNKFGSFLDFGWIQIINYSFDLWASGLTDRLKSKSCFWPLFPPQREVCVCVCVCVFGRRRCYSLGWDPFIPGVFSSRKPIPWGLTCIGLVTITWFSPKQSYPVNCCNSQTRGRKAAVSAVIGKPYGVRNLKLTVVFLFCVIFVLLMATWLTFCTLSRPFSVPFLSLHLDFWGQRGTVRKKFCPTVTCRFLPTPVMWERGWRIRGKEDTPAAS